MGNPRTAHRDGTESQRTDMECPVTEESELSLSQHFGCYVGKRISTPLPTILMGSGILVQNQLTKTK